MPDNVSIPLRKSQLDEPVKTVAGPPIILLMAVGIVLLISGNWNARASDGNAQKTDDAYVRADVTPFSTKVAGLVATVQVSDDQPVKSGQLLVELRDDDFLTQVQQAEAAVTSGHP